MRDAKLTRRALLSQLGLLSTMAVLPPLGRVTAHPAFPDYPFRLGVASGDPVSDGMVLWTRLAPDPLAGGGMVPESVAVHWQVAADARMSRVVQRGVASAHPDWAHSVHVEVHGLEPGRPYWYQFRAGGEVSPVGRTRTAPVYGAPLQKLRFAFASCQHYEHGYYAAYRHMADDDLDLVLHLGDYIYEDVSGSDEVRRHDGPKPSTLEGFRNRHALYKLDADLQAAHAACPWQTTWDDHEVENDYAGPFSGTHEATEPFLKRRAAAYQAYWEHMPLRRIAQPAGPDARLHQRLTFGDLVQFSILDERQYRSNQPCDSPEGGGARLVELAACPERLDPARTMLGAAQEQWLFRGLGRSTARWNVIAQQMLLAQFNQKSAAGNDAFWTEGWDAYPVARKRILDFIGNRRIANPVVLGGDIHSFWVTDLKTDFSDPASQTIATEFVGTSITSQPPPQDLFARLMPINPHVKFFEARKRGYVRAEITPSQWRADLRGLDNVRDPRSGIATIASFVVEDGRPGAQPA